MKDIYARGADEVHVFYIPLEHIAFLIDLAFFFFFFLFLFPGGTREAKSSSLIELYIMAHTFGYLCLITWTWSG